MRCAGICPWVPTSVAAKTQNSSSPPVVLCGTQCGFRPSTGIPGLTAAARSCQDSLGAKALCYFHTWPFTGECYGFYRGLLSPEGCCDLLHSWANVPQTHSLAFQELLLLVESTCFLGPVGKRAPIRAKIWKIHIIPEYFVLEGSLKLILFHPAAPLP